MVTVKLSDKKCVLCDKNGQTVQLKSKEHDFQGTVCNDHLFTLLKKWEKEESSVASE